MVTVDEIVEIVESLGVKSSIEKYKDYTKATLLLDNTTNRIFMVSVPKDIIEPGNDCTYSYFLDRDLVFSGYGVFKEVIQALKNCGFIKTDTDQ
jgi:hypothetical protein